MPSDPVAQILLFFLIPVWIAAGLADWLCHRAARIEENAGPLESVIHLLMLSEVGLPLLAGLLLEINSLIILAGIAAFVLHEATALWDLRYAASRREVTPIEQHVHNYLGMMPLMALVAVVALHWGQFLALLGSGTEVADFTLRWKTEPLPPIYVVAVLAAVLLLAVVPYVEELLRGLRERRRSAASISGASASPHY